MIAANCPNLDVLKFQRFDVSQSPYVTFKSQPSAPGPEIYQNQSGPSRPSIADVGAPALLRTIPGPANIAADAGRSIVRFTLRASTGKPIFIKTIPAPLGGEALADAITSLFGSGGLSSLYAPPSSGSSSSTAGSTFDAFGPDFFLGALTSSRIGASAGYTATGRPIGLPENAPQAKQRQADLKAVTNALKAGNLTAARAGVDRILKVFPNDVTATYNLARIQLLEGDYKGAEKSLLQVSQSSSDELITSDLRAARTLRKGPSETVAQIRRLLGSQKTAADGLKLADYFLQNQPDNAEAHLAVAEFYEGIGNLNLAGAELRQTIDKVPARNLSTVISHLEGFANRHSSDAGSYDLLAQAYAAAGSLDKAKSAFQTALRLSSDDPAFQADIRKDFADIYSRLGRQKKLAGDTSGALSAFEQAIDLRDDDVRRGDLSDLQFERSQALFKIGGYAQSLKALNEAYVNLPIGEDAERKDRLLPAYDRIIVKLTDLGDLKNLVTARAGAFNQDPADDVRKRDLAEAQNTYGLDLLSKNKYREAYRQFLAATRLYPGDTNYTANLSTARALF